MPHLYRPLERLHPGAVRAVRCRRVVPMVAGLAAALCGAGRAIAQDGGGAAAPGGEGAGNVVVTQPFPWGGLFLTIVLAGLCLFAVCRSSRRN